MARPKVPTKGPPPRKKAKEVMIATKVENPHTTFPKPAQVSGKAKDDKQVVSNSSSDDHMGIDSTNLTSSGSENEEVDGSRTLVHTPIPDGELLKQRRSELHSKAVHDPLAQLPAPPAPTTQQAT
uniref:Uncharacterized protein n=1 Tax=Solanum tuberosum TaxID=4113 RepID=M1DB89_SOLTU